MQLPFAICLEASHYAILELGLPNAGSHYAKLTAHMGQDATKNLCKCYFCHI